MNDTTNDIPRTQPIDSKADLIQQLEHAAEGSDAHSKLLRISEVVERLRHSNTALWDDPTSA